MNRLHFRNVVPQHVLDAHFQRRSGAGAAGAGTLHRQIDNAILEPAEHDVAAILRVDRIRLVLESAEASADAAPKVQKLEDVLTVVSPGFVDHYLTGGRNIPDRAVTLRQVGDGSDRIYGEAADWIASEALLKLDLGQGRLPALLVIGSEDPHQFRPSQGTDLLSFFTGVFERSMKRFLG